MVCTVVCLCVIDQIACESARERTNESIFGTWFCFANQQRERETVRLFLSSFRFAFSHHIFHSHIQCVCCEELPYCVRICPFGLDDGFSRPFWLLECSRPNVLSVRQQNHRRRRAANVERRRGLPARRPPIPHTRTHTLGPQRSGDAAST